MIGCFWRLRLMMGLAAGIRHSAAMLAFNRHVNASMVDPGFTLRVRRKLALDPREAAEFSAAA